MKYWQIALSTLIVLAGCQHRPANSDSTNSEVTNRLNLPKWTFLAKISTSFDPAYERVPKKAYVFPALRLNAQGVPIDQLSYRILEDDSLGWFSAAPLGMELKAVVESRLRSQGFVTIPFGELTASTGDHSALVINIYYREASASRDNPTGDPADSWTTFSRVTAATFPQNLDPSQKRDLMNNELVSLFNNVALGEDVIKRSQRFLLDYLGQNRQWSESINLLN
jgi:hypothetical protein